MKTVDERKAELAAAKRVLDLEWGILGSDERDMERRGVPRAEAEKELKPQRERVRRAKELVRRLEAGE